MNDIDINKEFERLKDDAMKYRDMKGRYVEYANKIHSLANQMESLARELDPFVVEKGIKGQYKVREQKKELYERILNGEHITSKIVRELYPNMPDTSVSNVMTQLKIMPGVDHAKDGIAIRLFMKSGFVR